MVPISNQVYQEPHTCPAVRMHPHKRTFAAQSSGDYICFFSTTKPFSLDKRKVR